LTWVSGGPPEKTRKDKKSKALKEHARKTPVVKKRTERKDKQENLIHVTTMALNGGGHLTWVSGGPPEKRNMSLSCWEKKLKLKKFKQK
jgi:hypothetical protein